MTRPEDRTDHGIVRERARNWVEVAAVVLFVLTPLAILLAAEAVRH